MKKFALGVASVVLATLLAACGSSNTDTSSAATMKPTPTPETAPAYVLTIYNGFSSILSSNTFSVSLDKDSLKKETADGEYEFSVSGGGQIIPVKISFDAYNGVTKKSFYFSTEFEYKTISSYEDLITIMLMATNSSLDKAIATGQMRKIVDSYQEKGPSIAVQSGDYLIYIGSAEYSNRRRVYAVYKDEIYYNINKSEYSKAVYETVINGRENKEQKVYLNGTIKSVSKKYDAMLGTRYTLAFKADDGKTYYLSYSYDSIPVILKSGGNYTAYGTILEASSGDYPWISLDLLELQ